MATCEIVQLANALKLTVHACNAWLGICIQDHAQSEGSFFTNVQTHTLPIVLLRKSTASPVTDSEPYTIPIVSTQIQGPPFANCQVRGLSLSS